MNIFGYTIIKQSDLMDIRKNEITARSEATHVIGLNADILEQYHHVSNLYNETNACLQRYERIEFLKNATKTDYTRRSSK